MRSAEALARLEEVAKKAAPVALAGEHVLPVLRPLEGLLPWGLRRGTSVQVDGVRAGVGSTSLALAVAAGPSAAGSWVAAVGVPSLGLAAAAGFGVDLGRVVMVGEPPPESWGTVVATMLDAFEVVIARPVGRRVAPGEGRRLAARARERGAVLLRLGDGWPEAADTTLTVVATEWEGLGLGHGHLRARRATVEAGGRRAADRPRRVDLWLPGPGGSLDLAPARVHDLAHRPPDPVGVHDELARRGAWRAAEDVAADRPAPGPGRARRRPRSEFVPPEQARPPIALNEGEAPPSGWWEPARPRASGRSRSPAPDGSVVS